MFQNGIISNLDLVLYLSSCEIDGLFDVEKDINLSIFQASEVYNNNNNDMIKANSLMVFEIKRGYQEKKLIKAMRKKFYSIKNNLQ